MMTVDLRDACGDSIAGQPCHACWSLVAVTQQLDWQMAAELFNDEIQLGHPAAIEMFVKSLTSSCPFIS